MNSFHQPHLFRIQSRLVTRFIHGINLFKQTRQGVRLASMPTHNGTHGGLYGLQRLGIETRSEIGIYATDFFQHMSGSVVGRHDIVKRGCARAVDNGA